MSLPIPETSITLGLQNLMLKYDAVEAIDHLKSADPVLARVMEQVGPFTLEPREGTFRMLSRAIFFQQLAGPAARAILGRVLATLGADEENWYTPAAFLNATDEQLRTAGLSRQKLAYLRDLAAKFDSGELSEDGFEGLDDDEVIAKVSAVKGIGRWTGEMFLIFSLGRPDVLPVTDYGVRKGFALAYGLSELPTPRHLLEHGERWRPHRTTAAWYLWRAVDLLQ